MKTNILFAAYILIFFFSSCQAKIRINDLNSFVSFKDSLFDQSISHEARSIMIYNSCKEYIYDSNINLVNAELGIILSTKLSSQYFYYLFQKEFDIFLKETSLIELNMSEKARLVHLLLLLSVDEVESSRDYRGLAFSFYNELSSDREVGLFDQAGRAESPLEMINVDKIDESI